MSDDLIACVHDAVVEPDVASVTHSETVLVASHWIVATEVLSLVRRLLSVYVSKRCRLRTT